MRLHDLIPTAPALLAAGALLLLSPSISSAPRAPAAAPQALATGGVVAKSHGASQHGTEVVAGGPAYKASFFPGGFRFTPALGSAAERNMPLEFRLESIGRGTEIVVRGDDRSAPTLADGRVSYLHAGGIEERYDVLAAGVEQSFVFPSRPAGEGDLVVRGRITTELAPAVATDIDAGLAFHLPGVGGVRVGAVSGVDATGRVVAGRLRLTGDVLELSLPGEFVDAARYPLVLDPLIGAEIDLGNPSFSDVDPDVAYCGDEATYLVVWCRIFSLVDADIRAQRVQSTGALLGGLIFVESDSNALGLLPAVGSSDFRDRFLVAWQSLDVGAGTPTQIRACAVDADDGDVSSSILVSSSANTQTEAAVGGERTELDDEVLVIWDEANVGIRGRQINLPATGAPIANGLAQQLLQDGFINYSQPAISRSGGDAGRYLVACSSYRSDNDTQSIVGLVVDRNLIPQSSGTIIATDFGTRAFHPAVDGDGEHWVVAYEREEFAGSFDSDIYAIAVHVDPDTSLRSYGGEQVVEARAAVDEHDPAVAFLGTHAVIAFTQEGTLRDGILLQSVDPITGRPSNERLVASDLLDDNGSAALASQYSGGGSLVTNEAFDDALVVWESLPFNATNSDIHAIRYDEGTHETDKGGDCGTGGDLSAPCAFAGNGNFAIHIRHAPANRPAFLAVSANEGALSCGPCTLVPVLDPSSQILAGTTDPLGTASFSIAIPPGLTGMTFVGQGLTLLNGGPCSLFTSVRLTNGIGVTVD